MPRRLACKASSQVFHLGLELGYLRGRCVNRAAHDVADHVDFTEGTGQQGIGDMVMRQECPIGARHAAGPELPRPEVFQCLFVLRLPDEADHAGVAAVKNALDGAREFALRADPADEIAMELIVGGGGRNGEA